MKQWIPAALCGCLVAGASGEEPVTNAVDSSPIVVTATRTAEEVRKVPGNPSVITAKDIEAGHYSSVPEALEKEAGVFFRNYADNPSQAAIDLRGFGGDAPYGKVLVLLNGRKLNRPDMAAANWAQIPMQAVERIEVVRGPNSVLYGDHAVGGVVNIITRDASDTPQTTLSATAGSDKAYTQNMVTSGSLDGLGYVATFGHQSGDGYRDRSRYDTLSGSLRLSGQLTERLSAYAEASVIQEQHQMPGALSAGQDRQQAANPNDAAQGKYYNFNTGLEALLTDELIASVDVGFSRKDLEADIDSWGSYYDYRIDSLTLSPKITLLAPLAGLDNRLIVGSDLVREVLDTQQYSDKARTAASLSGDTRVTKEIFGGYIADSLNLTDKLLLDTGIRIEQNRVHADHKVSAPYNDEIHHTENAWQVALNWLPTDSLKFFTGVERTYRYPFFDEQAIYSGWGNAFNKDLKPETGVNYEAGLAFTPRTNITIQATIFRTDMKDEIAWGSTQNENLDETTHRGLELSAEYRNSLFAVKAFYTWLQSEFTTDDASTGAVKGNEIPWVPQNRLDVSLALFLTDALTFTTYMNYTGSMVPLGDNTNTSTESQSEYAIFDLLLDYRLPLHKTDVTLFAGIDNVFATEYDYLVTDYGTAGYYPAPERTWKAGVSMTF